MNTNNDSSVNKHTIEEYLAMPYKRIVYPTGDSGNAAYFAEILELAGCYAEGSTSNDALISLDESMRMYFDICLKTNTKIPLPIIISKSKGKVLVRMSPELHSKLMLKAKSSGVSLNSCIVESILSGINNI